MKTFQGKFKVGDRVEWTSSGKAKEGTVAAIVPPLWQVDVVFNTLLESNKNYRFYNYGGGWARTFESYLVVIDAKLTGKVQQVYWPNVKWLKLVKSA